MKFFTRGLYFALALLGLGAAKVVADPVEHHMGASTERDVSRYATVPVGEGQYKFKPTRPVSAMHGKTVNVGWGPSMPYTGTAGAVLFTETKDNSSTIAYNADGVNLAAQASPAATDDTAIKPVLTKALTQRSSGVPAKWRLDWDVYVSNLTDEGWQVWCATSTSTELWTADANDEILIQKAKSANTYSIRVAENGNAAKTATVTLPVTPAASVHNSFSLIFEVGTATDGSDSIIEVWCDGQQATISGGDGLAALKQALYTMYATSVPTLTAGCSRRCNGTTQRNTNFRAFHWTVD